MRPFWASAIGVLAAAFFIRPAVARPPETAVVGVVLNGENKGEFFVNVAAENDFLVREQDLRAMGFRRLAGDVTLIEGEPYLSLRSIGGVLFEFDEKTVTLRMTAPPDMLPKRTIDFTPQRQAKVYYPRDSGGFLNYGIRYHAGRSFALQSLDVTNTIGARVGDFLLLSDSTFRKTPGDRTFTRLMSNLTYDRRPDLTRAVIGDLFASSGNLGNSLNLGGVSFSKVFRIDPYFVQYPLASFSGLVALPSEAEIYLDGSRIRTERLSPGEFEIRNLTSYDGAGVVTVVIRDPFGAERQIVYPHYFTDALLKKGLHEYSYNAGFLREEFGTRSSQYGGPAFSGFHRYGTTDSLTLGFRGEGDRDGMNAGPTATYRIGLPGVVTVSLAGSLAKGGAFGAAGLADYVYQDRRVGARVSLRGFTKEYAIAGDPGTERTRYDAGAGASYAARTFGSVSFQANVSEPFTGTDQKVASITYSRNLNRKTTAFLTYRYVREDASREEVFLGLTYYPWRDHSASAGYERSDGTDRGRVQFQKNQPVGEGIGYRGTFERENAPGGSTNRINPFFQYNGRYGIYSAEFLGEYGGPGGDAESYRLSASGGVAYVGDTVGFSRPIADSFGLVSVGGLEGVRVYRNNQEIGRTDGKGRVFVPDLGSYFENQISIADGDIPFDYSLAEVTKFVSPPLRSGSVIPFEVHRIQAFTGTLRVQSEGKVFPAEYREVTMGVGDREIVFPTGKGGEFYLENVPAGRHRATVLLPDGPCVFDLFVPESDEVIVDLGEVTCEGRR